MSFRGQKVKITLPIPNRLFFHMKTIHNSLLTVYRMLQHSKEWISRVLIWDAQNGYVFSKLLVNLIIDFGNWGQMCQDVVMTALEYFGYIIP